MNSPYTPKGHCPYCLRKYSKSYVAMKKKETSVAIKAGIRRVQESGKHVGRPKKRNDEQIFKLWNQYKSVREIATELKISRSSVEDGLRASLLKEVRRLGVEERE